MLTAAIARHLADAGIVKYGVAGTDCFLEDLPGSPAAAVGIYQQGGQQANPYVGRPYVQVIVRGDPSDAQGRAGAGYKRALSILYALDGLTAVTLDEGGPDEVRVSWILVQEPLPRSLGADDNNAVKWSVRFDVETPDAASRAAHG